MGRGSRPGGPSLCISPLATNASPLDHARRAAEAKLRETIICLRFRDCGTDSSGFPFATLLPNF